MSDDLISRQAALKAITKAWTRNMPMDFDVEGAFILTALSEVPSAQSEIIRCKDCKHRIVNEHAGEKGYLNLNAMCELDSGDPFELGRCAEDDEWFCADAERREDETD